MTPNSCLSALVTQLQGVSGMKESRSPQGVRNSSGGRINRAWSVKVTGMVPSSNPGRGRVDTSGIRVAQRYIVEIAHQLKPSTGQLSPGQSQTDLLSIIQAIVATGTSLTQEGVPDIKTVSAEYLSGGAYLVQSIVVEVTYPLALA